jgi:putative membrane protein
MKNSVLSLAAALLASTALTAMPSLTSANSAMNAPKNSSMQNTKDSTAGMPPSGATATAEQSQTSTFLQKAAISNQFEINTSQLVDQRSTNKDVKSLAAMLIKDHTKAGQEMRSLVTAQNLSMPSTTLDQMHEKKFEKLQALKSTDFDREFSTTQIDAHREAVNLFQAYARNGENASVKNWASKTLPVLRKHLADAQRIERSVSASNETTSPTSLIDNGTDNGRVKRSGSPENPSNTNPGDQQPGTPAYNSSGQVDGPTQH